MPIYEYCCEDCRQIFEEWQKDFQDRDKVCPVCGGSRHRPRFWSNGRGSPTNGPLWPGSRKRSAASRA